MLGRLRMTVPDCIHEYRRLGQLVFGNPRFFTSINFGVGDSYKYEATRLEKVFKDVTKRRNEMPTGDYFRPITFPSRSGLCTTYVSILTSTLLNLWIYSQIHHKYSRTFGCYSLVLRFCNSLLLSFNQNGQKQAYDFIDLSPQRSRLNPTV